MPRDRDTGAGLSGIVETDPRNAAEAEVTHSHRANGLLGKAPHDVERIWADPYHAIEFQIAGGPEIRQLSAIDIAFRDLLGHSLQAPVWRLIGGWANPRVRIYNTCFPHEYDLLPEPEKIMRELISKHGIRTIKICPSTKPRAGPSINS